MKKILYLIVLFAHTSLIAQWTQLGNEMLGEAEGDNFGYSSSFNADGTVVVSGGWSNDEAGDYAGHVRVYEWDGADWAQRGSDIDGLVAGDWSGYRVAINGIGDRIAVTSVYGVNEAGLQSGIVRVFDWDGTSWIQAGSDLEGTGHPVILETYGIGLSFSHDGNTLAIGGSGYSAILGKMGYVRVFTWNDSDWLQIGSDITGEAEFDEFGFSISLNKEGDRLAVGAIGNFGYGINQAGYVEVFERVDEEWSQLGERIIGEVVGDEFGKSVSLNADGNILAIGAPGYELTEGDEQTTAYVYSWDGSSWTQLGSTFFGVEPVMSFGSAVSLNADGTILAVGNPKFYTFGTVQIYKWAGEAWSQIGETIEGAEFNSLNGNSLKLNAIGNKIAIAAWGYMDIGHVRVFMNDSLTAGITENRIGVEYYPNPVTEELHVSAETEILAYQILSTDGKLIEDTQIENKMEFTIHMNHLSAGSYIILIQTRENVVSTRILKR